MSESYFDEEYDDPDEWTDDDDEDADEWVYDCGDPECCMNFAPHFRSECHTPEMYEQQARRAEREGKHCPDGDWVGDKEPGGMDCNDCGCIFISNEGRPYCKVCHEAHSSVSEEVRK